MASLPLQHLTRRRTRLQFTVLQRVSIRTSYSLTTNCVLSRGHGDGISSTPLSLVLFCIDKPTHYTQSTPYHHQSLPALVHPTPPALSSPPAHPYPSVHSFPLHPTPPSSKLSIDPTRFRPLSISLDAHPNPIPSHPIPIPSHPHPIPSVHLATHTHPHTPLPPSLSPYHTLHPSPSFESSTTFHISGCHKTPKGRGAPTSAMS